MFKALRKVIAALDARDAFVFSGIASMFFGLFQVYSPAAWIVTGTALFWIGVRR